MILVVADTGPIHYLVLVEAIGVLPRLYDRVIIPRAVLAELSHRNAPASVRHWATNLPSWAEVRRPSRVESTAVLGPGETEAIALCQELQPATVLLDETEARQEALRLGLPVSGTVGVLERAAEQDLLNLPEVLDRLRRTNFRIAPELLQQALSRDAERQQRRPNRRPDRKP